jgi:hypothetical protein
VARWSNRISSTTNLSFLALTPPAHLLEITSAFEFAVLTLTVPGLRFRKYQNPVTL